MASDPHDAPAHDAPSHDAPATSSPGLPRTAFDKLDPSDDALFYAPPRLVTHIDDAAIRALSAFYRQRLRPGSDVLDLMSSWVSHLPPEMAFASVTGHGMNAEELAANPRLTRAFVQDLNRDVRLPLDDESLDAALCCVGVQYLQKPVEVFAEVARALRPTAPVIVSFSNRCFPTKAVEIWRELDPEGQARLVQFCLQRAGLRDAETHLLADGRTGDPLVAVVARR